MRNTLPDILSRFEASRFGSHCAVYRKYVQEMLAVPEIERRTNSEGFYEALEGIIDGLFDNFCGGTLSQEERTELFQVIRGDWADDVPGCTRASMVGIINALRPLDGVSSWLIEIADRQDDAKYAEYLRRCADFDRDSPAV